MLKDVWAKIVAWHGKTIVVNKLWFNALWLIDIIFVLDTIARIAL